MKSMSKKILAVALVLTLALSLSIAAYAVDVTGVTLNKTTLSLDIGYSETLTATVAPADATNKTVTWSSSNTNVARVGSSSGTVLAVGDGTATITATAGGKTATCTVTVDNTTSTTASLGAILNSDDDYVDLEELVEDYVFDWAYDLGMDPDDVILENVTGFNYLEEPYYDDYEECYLYDYDDYEKLPLLETLTCTVTIDDVTCLVSLDLTLYSPDLVKDFGVSGGSLSSIASDIDTMLNLEYGEGIEYIEIYDADLAGGTLYADSNMTEEAYETEYTESTLADLYYLPNGSGDTSVLEYVAYTDDGEDISGYLYLTADEYMLLSGTISNKETLTLDAEVFEEVYLDLDDDYAYLEHVRFTSNVPNSSSKGYLYIDYESEGDDADKVTSSSSKKYYVDPDDDEIGIDAITYVPGSTTKSTVVTVTFRAYGVDEDGDDVSYVTGYLRINVVEAADLEVYAGKGETVEIDPDFFEDYLKENGSGNRKNYDITRVVISGAPSSSSAGYLVSDDSRLTGSGSKSFYANPDDDQYDLEDMWFQAGNTSGTTRATFSIYGKSSTASATSSGSKLVEGTIDFVVGASHNLPGATQAAQVQNFATSLTQVEALGNNDNEYVIFTSLPVGGKLVYNWGTAQQEPVTLNTKYYLSYVYGEKALANVYFVPNYAASKVSRVVSIPVTAGNAKGKEVKGSFDITVNHAYSSAYFSDVQLATYSQAQKYADSVDFLRNLGITKGNNAAGTTFGVNANVTRAEFVTFLYRAAGQPAITGVTNTFTDVSATTHKDYYNAILWAVKNGITNGKGGNKFDPDANVTHEELLTFLYRYDVTYKKNPGTPGSLYGFIDSNQIASWAQDAAKWAAGKGVISYYYDGYSLLPTTAGTRGTVALWLHRMLTL